MVHPGKDERLTFLQNFVCGAASGIVAKSLISPLEVVRVLAQVGTKESRSGLSKTFKNVYRNEGLKAFWKGNGISCLRLFPYSAIQFTAFNNIAAVLVDSRSGHLSYLNSVIAGSASTAVATVLVYPADVLKTRLTVQHVKPALAKYQGILHGLFTMLKEEGFRSWYKGLLATLIGILPFTGGTFMAYEMLDNFIDWQQTDVMAIEMFFCGCLASAIAQTVAFPLDVIRKKLQAQSFSIPGGGGVDIEFRGMKDCFVQIIKSNGVTGLWRGNTANLLKIVPNAGLMILAFESAKRSFLFSNGYTESPFSEVLKDDVDQSMTPYELNLYRYKEEENAS